MNRLFLTCLLSGAVALSAVAQNETSTKKEGYVFTPVKELKITSIKDQSRTGTCWSFSGLGFWEMEALRKSNIDVDLSPMFVVSHSYKDKARRYMRMHGYLNFAQGGSFYDVLYVIKHYGIVPLVEMEGLNYGMSNHNHNELEAGAKGYLKAIQKESETSNSVSPVWTKGFDAIIDAYLGKAPETFTFNGKTYTPKSFANALGLNPDEYVSLTSFSHHPFYSQFVLEIPDNWRMSSSYNLPIDELMEVFDNAINNGYGIAWGADVSEPGFTRNGIGVLIDVEAASSRGSDQERWIGATNNADRRQMIQQMINNPNCPEINPTQEYRQEGFDNYSTTDDHGMVIYGIAKDQTGKKFYMVKNSWGDAGAYNGIWYISENFVKGKTINIVVHKDAVPSKIRKKLGI